MFSIYSSNNNQPILTSNEGKGVLGLALVLAVIAHVILLVFIKLPSNPKNLLQTTFEVELRPFHEPILNVEPIEHAEFRSNVPKEEQPELAVQSKKLISKKSLIIPNDSANDDSREINTQSNSNVNNEKPTEIIPSNTTISYEDLLESARYIAKEDAKNMPNPKDDGVLLSDQAFSPKLAQTLAKKEKVVGMTSYADGMTKVITSSGTEYCFQPSPLMSKGAFENNPIAMTCP